MWQTPRQSKGRHRLQSMPQEYLGSSLHALKVLCDVLQVIEILVYVDLPLVIGFHEALTPWGISASLR